MARHARPSAKMLQGSLFLMASAVLTAGIGFLFWAVVARLYTAERIGLATALLSAISLISFLSLFGLNSTLIRFPAPGKARDSQVTLALTAVTVTSAGLGVAYLAGLGLFSARLEFLWHSPPSALAFVVICVLASVNLLTDSVFIGARVPEYNALVDGILQSLAKLAMPVFLVALGAVGIVTATGVGYAVAVGASLVFMHRKLGYRPDFRTRGTRLRASARYSATSYVSALLNLVPLLVLPTVVLRALGPAQAAYFFLAFQIATLLSAVSHAIGDTLFAAGSQDPTQTRNLLARSAVVMAVVVAPCSVLAVLLRGPVLGVFGSQYTAHGQAVLAVLSVGSIAVALNTWASSALRILGRMPQLLASNVVYSGVILSFAAAFASHGLVWVGAAWVLGNLLSALVAAALIPGHVSAGRAPSEDRAGATTYETYGSPEADETDRALWTYQIYEVDEGPGHENEQAWAGVGDAPTEPLFLPWNRPESNHLGSRARPAVVYRWDREQPAQRGPELRFAGGMRTRPRQPPKPPPTHDIPSPAQPQPPAQFPSPESDHGSSDADREFH